jgi:hypothetical protein
MVDRHHLPRSTVSLLSYLMSIFVIVCVLFHYVCVAVLHTAVAGMLARSQYLEGPATGHLGTGFSWFPCVYKRMLRWFPRLQVATACFSCSPPDLNYLDPYFIFMYMHYNHCHRATAHLQLNIQYYFILYYIAYYYFQSLTPLKFDNEKAQTHA